MSLNGMCELMPFHTSQWMSTQHIFWFARSGKREVDVNRVMSKHNSDYNVIFCHDHLSQLAIDASSHIKFSDAYKDRLPPIWQCFKK